MQNVTQVLVINVQVMLTTAHHAIITLTYITLPVLAHVLVNFLLPMALAYLALPLVLHV